MGHRISAQLPWLLLLLLAGACDARDGGGGGAAGADGAAGEVEDATRPDGAGTGSETGQPDASGPGTEPPSHPDAAEHTDDSSTGDPAPAAGGSPTDGSPGVEPPPPDATDPPTDPLTGPGVDDGTGSAGTGGDSSDMVSECDLSNTRTHIGGRQVEEGELCDDVVVCVDDAAAASAIAAIAPDFDCDSGENPIGLCGVGQRACIWRPSVLDAGEAATVCALTTVLPDGGELVCVVYL